MFSFQADIICRLYSIILSMFISNTFETEPKDSDQRIKDEILNAK